MLIPAQLLTIVRRLRTSSYRMQARMNHGKNDHDRTTRLARWGGGVPVLGSSQWNGPNQEPLFETPEVPETQLSKLEESGRSECGGDSFPVEPET